MKRLFGLSTGLLALTALMFVTACATDQSEKTEKHARKKKSAPILEEAPSTVKFGEFKNVEVKPFSIAEKYAEKERNQKAASFMDEQFTVELAKIFPNLKVLPAGADFSKGGERTLQITPVIEEIRLVSTGARIWVGAMAGNSRILIQVKFQDSATGQVIAQPEFYEKAGAWSDVWGQETKKSRTQICTKICYYILQNK